MKNAPKKIVKKSLFVDFGPVIGGGCHHGNPKNTRNVSMCLGFAHNIFHIILEIKIK